MMFLTTVLKRVGGGSWNFVTLNINLWSIEKRYFLFPRLSSVTIATSLPGSSQDFLKLSFHMFPYNEILKVFESKIWNKYPKTPLNTKFHPDQSRGLGVTSIWNLDLRHWLKYRLWRHNYVIVVTSQTFLSPLCRIHQAYTFVKFHDHSVFL